MAQSPKLLFVSPYIPNPKATVAADGIDFFYYRNTIGQGVFQLRQMQSWHPLHFLAQNLPVQSVVLENRTMPAFQQEVMKGRYDVVAISFTALAATRILGMVTWLRECAPPVETILGGYGTSIFADTFSIADQLKSSVNRICYGEGLEFIRSYLRDRWGVNGGLPVQQVLLPTRVSLFRTRLPNYLDEDLFGEIEVEWMEYYYTPYQQMYGDFEHAVSILDVLFNVGPDIRYIRTNADIRRV